MDVQQLRQTHQTSFKSCGLFNPPYDLLEMVVQARSTKDVMNAKSMDLVNDGCHLVSSKTTAGQSLRALASGALHISVISPIMSINTLVLSKRICFKASLSAPSQDRNTWNTYHIVSPYSLSNFKHIPHEHLEPRKHQTSQLLRSFPSCSQTPAAGVSRRPTAPSR